MMKFNDIHTYVQNKYHTVADYPWQKFPEYSVLRHSDTQKWYGLLMRVSGSKLGQAHDEPVDLLEVKLPKDLVSQLRIQAGFLPAYHMNKDNWLAIVLDGADEQEVFALLDQSYELTQFKPSDKTAQVAHLPAYEVAYTPEQREIADHIIALEKDALDKWFKGDVSGYREIWSKHSFSYFDIVRPHRVDTYEEISKFLDDTEGRLYAEHYDFLVPRVQFGQDIAILTYQLHADTNLLNTHYNCVEVFQKEADGWKVVQSTWSPIRPMDWDFSGITDPKDVL
ncbi:MmcQ/YjbR family DNA-binding protein [Exercitatus varius]|nr:MmcQ/YjbR family DNA-binding protein [Exercitatus varius]MDG2941356.1 MmcQ/YjbR family DNA-binding protein [Exercitatus varius]